MQVDRDAERVFGAADAGDVIHVRVGQQDAVQPDLFFLRKIQQRLDFVARIDQHAFAGARARDDEAVLEERTDGLRLDYDHGVILAILDDLMFTSKIKTAAKQLGVPLAVARSRDGALSDMRTEAPSLVILDLNNPRTDPIGIVGAMKADPALASIRTVGFSHHTQTDAIERPSRRAWTKCWRAAPSSSACRSF